MVPCVVQGISWVQPRNFKLLFLPFLWLSCSSYPFIMWCIPLRWHGRWRLCCIPLVNRVLNELVQLKGFNWKFGLFMFIPRARDWFDLFVRFTPHIAKVNSRCFLWYPAAMLVYHGGTPIWRLHTELYKYPWNALANNSWTLYCTDLRLGEVVYLLIFDNVWNSWALLLNDFEFIFVWRESATRQFRHVLFSRVLEQVNDQGMRDGKGVHTIRYSCYHKEKGVEKTGGGAANTSKAR